MLSSKILIKRDGSRHLTNARDVWIKHTMKNNVIPNKISTLQFIYVSNSMRSERVPSNLLLSIPDRVRWLRTGHISVKSHYICIIYFLNHLKQLFWNLFLPTNVRYEMVLILGLCIYPDKLTLAYDLIAQLRFYQTFDVNQLKVGLVILSFIFSLFRIFMN